MKAWTEGIHAFRVIISILQHSQPWASRAQVSKLQEKETKAGSDCLAQTWCFSQFLVGCPKGRWKGGKRQLLNEAAFRYQSIAHDNMPQGIAYHLHNTLESGKSNPLIYRLQETLHTPAFGVWTQNNLDKWVVLNKPTGFLLALGQAELQWVSVVLSPSHARVFSSSASEIRPGRWPNLEANRVTRSPASAEHPGISQVQRAGSVGLGRSWHCHEKVLPSSRHELFPFFPLLFPFPFAFLYSSSFFSFGLLCALNFSLINFFPLTHHCLAPHAPLYSLLLTVGWGLCAAQRRVDVKLWFYRWRESKHTPG